MVREAPSSIQIASNLQKVPPNIKYPTVLSTEGTTSGDRWGNNIWQTEIAREIRVMYLGWNQMVRIAEMKYKMKLLNLLTSTINYFAMEPKSSGDCRRQWIDRDEKLHCLHLKSDGREIRDRKITRLAQRIRAFFGRKRGTKSGMWKHLM